MPQAPSQNRRKLKKRLVLSGVIVSLVVALAGCAQTGEVRDPLEPMNRKVHSFNTFFDRWLLKPVAKGYVVVVPNPIRRGVGNFFDNLLYPTVVINQFLQGKAAEGGRDTMRFLTNTTVGLGGLFDVASHWGLEKHEEDFGQTFAVWGFGRGPYLVLPIVGPSTPQSAIGDFAGIYTYPATYLDDDTLRWSLFGLRAIDARAGLLDSEGMLTGDRYLFIRDAYLQKRSSLIRDGEPLEEDPFLDE